MNPTAWLAITMSFAVMFYGSSCSPPNPDDLDKLGFVDLTIKGTSFHLWLADDYSEQEKGLMFVTAERMAPLSNGTQRGMIFVFDHERELNFWMKNTIIPLDIAYVDSNGLVVNKHTMAPLDDRLGQYPSGKPARFAIEVNAGVFTDLGVKAGDKITIPDSVLKRTR